MPANRLAALPVLLLLGACGGDADQGPERKTAAGEVLGGTISDEMLPLDRVQSQSPPLTGGDDAAASKAEEDAPGQPTAAAADAAPSAASATGTPTPAARASATPQAED